MADENRKDKDSVFTDLFYSDESAAANLLSLYNALYGTHFTDPSIVDKVRLEDVIFMNFKNDLAALVNQKRLFLAEQQSTVNDNMPLRMLMYVGREYEKLVDHTLRYKRNMVKIPTPQFITFYNGTEDFPAEKILRLSDAFAEHDAALELDLQVRVININAGSGADILRECGILREYSEFIDTARRRKRENPSGGLEDAVKECIAKGILSDYLAKKSTEVINMLTAEYNYQEDISVKQEEARAEGRAEGFQEGGLVMLATSIRHLMSNLHISAEEAMASLSVTSEQRAALKKMM